MTPSQEAALWRQRETDALILGELARGRATVVDLTFYGFRPGELERLLDEKAVVRRWDGNQRFGRFVYCIANESQ